jgi:RimJ/RimL family protein N-acetyltransferase
VRKPELTSQLVGSKCVVRPFVITDAESIASVANDRRIWLQLRDLFPHPYQVADAESFIGRVAAVDPPLSLAIVIDGLAVGVVGLEPMTDVNRLTAEIGYWIGAAFWGRGVATEAVALATDWSFRTHGLLRLFAQPFAGNFASRRVLEKAGYQLEGTMRHSAIKDGEIQDQCLYARLDPSAG